MYVLHQVGMDSNGTPIGEVEPKGYKKMLEATAVAVREERLKKNTLLTNGIEGAPIGDDELAGDWWEWASKVAKARLRC